jgi:hypothetical protein
MPHIDISTFGSLAGNGNANWNSGSPALLGTGTLTAGAPLCIQIGKPTGGSLPAFFTGLYTEVHFSGTATGGTGASFCRFSYTNDSSTEHGWTPTVQGVSWSGVDVTYLPGTVNTLADIHNQALGWAADIVGGGVLNVTAFFVRAYYQSIDVTAITPTHGPIAGNTPVVISGDGFTTVSSVTFDGIAATSVVVVNSNTITCITPPHATGVYIDVVITATDGSTATLPASYQYRNVPFSWTVNGIPSVGGNPPTVPLDFNDPINIVTTVPNGVPTGIVSPSITGTPPDGITTPIYITYTPTSGAPITIQIPQNPIGINPTAPVPIGAIPILPPLPGINPLIPIVLSGTPTEFSGTVALGLFTITIVNGAGIYVITPGNTADTLYVNSPINNTTAQVKFPDPFIKTAFIP